MVKHPATYTESFLPLFAKLLTDKKVVLDPFAGSGKLAKIKEYGFKGSVICNEIEKEWAESNLYPVDMWRIGDAQDLSWALDLGVDAICTSPTYGNRMADHHNAKDSSRRITYKHYLGRDLSENNTGSMQWGERYKAVHSSVYFQCFNLLPKDGLMILNVSNHIRKGEEIKVVDWHIENLTNHGFAMMDHLQIETPRMRFGANSKKRVLKESILIFNR